MKRFESIIAAAPLVLLASCATTNTQQSEEAVLATLESWNQGWAQRDAELAVRDYADDADWTNAFGDRFQGKDELQDGLTFIFSLDFVMAGESEESEILDVRFLSPDVALIRSKLTRRRGVTVHKILPADRRHDRADCHVGLG